MLHLKELESLIDGSSVQKVLEDIVVICEEKSDHIQTNWQDMELAKEWKRAAEKIQRVVESIRV